MNPPAFTLDPGAPLPARLTGYYQKKYDDYNTTYGLNPESGSRTIKRWVAAGRKASPPDLPPLDQPSLMPAWWMRRMKQTAPAGILAAAGRDKSTPPPLPKQEAPPGAALPPPHAAVPQSAPTPSGVPMDLSALNLDEGDDVKQARQLVAGLWSKLESAYGTGNDDAIRMWQPRWENARKALGAAEKNDLDRRSLIGMVLDRSAVEADMNEAIEMLKMMRENMPRRLKERLPAIEPDLWEKIESVLISIREKEDLVFANLPSLRRGELQRALA